MIMAGAAAALTVIGAGMVRFPTPGDGSTSTGETAGTAAGTDGSTRSTTERGSKAKAMREVRYVRLRPGQKAPAGAKVIREAAPTPRIVVRRSAGSSVASSGTTRSTAPTRARVVTRTRQSG
jgi:hypothetical protein